MIGWLLENNIEFAKKLFNSEDLLKVEKVSREKYNFDLLVTLNIAGSEKSYVIENKVKSLPDVFQMKSYQEKAKKQKLAADFMLLSLVPASSDFQDSISNVRCVSYEEILDLIANLNIQVGYIQAILKDYQLLLQSLIRIKSFAEIKCNQEKIAFDIANEIALKEIRLFDVAQKIRFSSLAVHIEKILKTLIPAEFARLKAITEIGLTRSLGLISYKFRFYDTNVKRDLLIGIQIQGDDYRLFLEAPDGSDVLDLAKKLQQEGLWLNPTNESKLSILKFGKCFKYSKASIKGITVEVLVERVCEDVLRIFSNVEAMKCKLGVVIWPQCSINQTWSDVLRQETRDAISNMRIGKDGKMYFKNLDKGSAFVTAEDLQREKIILVGTENGVVFEYSDTNDLLAAGWALD
jgi:hypothetical protein